MIELTNVSVSLDGRSVLNDIDLTVAGGEWLALIGPNGAGKTTLLRVLGGLVPFTGSATVDGVDTAIASRRTVARTVSLVPQSPQMPPALTVAEYVLLGRNAHVGYFSTENRGDHDATARAINRMGLSPFAERPLGSLSGGERQRAVLARALAQEASVLLLDEPTTALDLGHQQRALELIDRLRGERRLTVVSALHDLTLAGQYAERLLLLDCGHVAAEGTPELVLTEATVAASYGARVTVRHEHGRVLVAPRRGERT